MTPTRCNHPDCLSDRTFYTRSSLSEHWRGHAYGRLPAQPERNERIRREARLGLSQSAIAAIHGLSATRVSQIVTGRRS